MTDAAQILLFLVILILTTLLLVLGIQVFFILKELRKTLNKTNKVLDNTDEITESIKRPLSSLSALLMGLRAGTSLVNLIKKTEDSSVREAQDKKKEEK